jgi:hypothetical protein
VEFLKACTPKQYEQVKAVWDDVVEGIHDKRQKAILNKIWDELFVKGSDKYIIALLGFDTLPPTIEEYFSDKYLGELAQSLYPKWMPYLKQMRPDPLLTDPKDYKSYTINNSSISTGKSFVAMHCLIYDMIVLSCHSKPQLIFGLAPTTQIIIAVTSTNSGLTAGLFKPIRQLLDSNEIPLRKYLKFNKNKISEIEIPSKNLVMYPVSPQRTHFLGKAIISSFADEINFMEVYSASNLNQGAAYDVGEDLAQVMKERRESRFIGSNMPICIGGCIFSSSVSHEGDVLSRMLGMADRSTTNIIQLRPWEVNENKFKGPRAYFGLGDKMGIITDEIPDYPHEWFPAILKPSAIEDPAKFARNYFNLPIGKAESYFPELSKLIDVQMPISHHMPMQPRITNIISPSYFEFMEGAINPPSGEVMTFWHNDLSASKDKTGIAGAYVVDLKWTNYSGQRLLIPVIGYVFAGTITPSKSANIVFDDITQFYVRMANDYRINIKVTSFDQFQSAHIIQSLKVLGINATLGSVDINNDPYIAFKKVVYDKAIQLPYDTLLIEELVNLRLVSLASKTKIDHQKHSCVVGETLIKLTDGTSAMIKDLVHEKEFEVYGVDKEGNTVKTMGRNARITKEVTELIELTLENGETLKCTSCHPILLSNGTYKRAGDLTEDDDLMETGTCDVARLYANKDKTDFCTLDASDLQKVASYSWNPTSRGYFTAYWGGKPKVVKLHRLLTAVKEGQIIDHIDRNPRNNTKANLRIVSQHVNSLNINGVSSIKKRGNSYSVIIDRTIYYRSKSLLEAEYARWIVYKQLGLAEHSPNFDRSTLDIYVDYPVSKLDLVKSKKGYASVTYNKTRNRWRVRKHHKLVRCFKGTTEGYKQACELKEKLNEGLE